MFLVGASLLLVIGVMPTIGLLRPDTAVAASLWDQQLGRDELGTPFGSTGNTESQDLRNVVVRLIKLFLSFLGLIMVILIIYGGFRWMTAGGNEKNVDEAKQWIKNAIIGLIIILFSYIITYFIDYAIYWYVFNN